MSNYMLLVVVAFYGFCQKNLEAHVSKRRREGGGGPGRGSAFYSLTEVSDPLGFSWQIQGGEHRSTHKAWPGTRAETPAAPFAVSFSYGFFPKSQTFVFVFDLPKMCYGKNKGLVLRRQNEEQNAFVLAFHFQVKMQNKMHVLLYSC